MGYCFLFKTNFGINCCLLSLGGEKRDGGGRRCRNREIRVQTPERHFRLHSFLGIAYLLSYFQIKLPKRILSFPPNIQLYQRPDPNSHY